MNASKENAAEAQNCLARIRTRTHGVPADRSRDFEFLHEFLHRAKAKLPCEASFPIHARVKKGVVP